MTDLDEEARRIAAAHPWAGTATETHTTAWQPQHAVPRRPARYGPTEAGIEARVAMDLERIDRELDPQAPPPVFGNPLRLAGDDGVGPGYFAARDAMHDRAARMQAAYARSRPWPGVQDWFAANWQDAYAPWRAFTVDPASVHIEEDDAWRQAFATPPSPFPKQRKPKTYVAPGRKPGRTWIARLEQSKQAKRRTR